MYNYQTEPPHIFTEEGQVMFLKIRDNTKRLLGISGVARMQEMISVCSGSTWHMIACVDRMVELREIREVSPPGCMAQHRLFSI